MEDFRKHQIRRLRHQLINDFGSIGLVDQQMDYVEDLFSQGKSYPEILRSIKNRMESLNEQRSEHFPPVYKYPETMSPGRALPPHSPRFEDPLIKEYKKRREVYEQDAYKQREEFEKNFPVPKSWEFYAKIDEKKALEAQKIQDKRARQLEMDRVLYRKSLEMDTRRVLDQQLEECNKKIQRQKDIDKKFRQELDARLSSLTNHSIKFISLNKNQYIQQLNSPSKRRNISL